MSKKTISISELVGVVLSFALIAIASMWMYLSIDIPEALYLFLYSLTMVSMYTLTTFKRIKQHKS